MISVISILIVLAGTPASVSTTLSYSAADCRAVFTETPRGDFIVSLPEGFIGTLEGYPDLPGILERVPLEPDEKPISVFLENCRWETVSQSISVRPLPAPLVLSGTPSGADTPLAQVYGEDEFWPSSPVALAGCRRGINGNTAYLIVHPFRYNPVSGELQRLVSCRVIMELETFTTDGAVPLPSSQGLYMLLITDESIREPFDSLAAWRTDQGIPTEVVTTDVVYSTAGVDNAERIRNYIIQRYTEDGIQAVLLGGDTNHIPCRFAYPMSYEWYGGRDDNMPCDLYYSDLDGNWNLNGDTIWGEVADSVDLWQEVIVGRAPCENADEAWTFWNKIKTYETTVPGHLETCLLAAGVLWEDPFTDDAVVKMYIKEHHIPQWFTNTELYTTTGNYNTTSVVNALNQGAGYVNLNDHGWISGVGCLGLSDASGLNSDGKFFGMMYSIGCWTSAFDYDCVSERFLNNPDGGGLSYIGNSSYGWGSPGNPLFGYSDRFDREIFKLLFEEPDLTLGELLAEAKDSYIPFAGQENCYRCVLYMVNLLGDPVMHTFRESPLEPVVEAPGMVSGNTMTLPVTVTPGGGTRQITACLRNGDCSIYMVEELDGSGHTVFQFSEPPDGDLKLTVTGTDLCRTSVTIPFESGPRAVISAVETTSPQGYAHPAPGSTANLSLTISNSGTTPLTGVSVNAQLVSGPGNLTQEQSTCPGLLPGESAECDDDLVLTVNGDASTGEILKLQMEIVSDQGTWSSTLPMLVYAPGVYFTGYSTDDTAGGNGNGYAEPGESFTMHVNLANTGLLEASGVTAEISSVEEWLTWTSDSSWTEEIKPESTFTFSFQGFLDENAPAFAFPEITLSTAASPQWSGTEDFTFVTGLFHSSSDFETGAQNWTHQGEPDQWHLTESSAHSGSFAWWCGDESTGEYAANMDCSLVSQQLVPAPDGELSFWCCFDVDLYGADGLYVLLCNDETGATDTLDFIGAGGLLGSTPFSLRGNMMWLPRSYSLSSLDQGTLFHVEFCFHSDDEEANAGSFHIDDVTIDGYAMENGSGGGVLNCTAGYPCPNPSSGSFSIPVHTGFSDWELRVFDLAGRVLYESSGTEPYSGNIQVNIPRAGSGLYFTVFSSGENTEVRKTIVVRL